MTQLEIENKYSRKNILADIRVDAELSSLYDEVKASIIEWLKDYEDEVYPNYESKTSRLNMFKKYPELLDTLPSEMIYISIVIGQSTYQNFVGQLVPLLPDEYDIQAKAKTAAELWASVEGLLVELVRPKRSNRNWSEQDNHILVSLLDIDNDTYARWSVAMFLPPMIEKPLDWANKTDGGYFTTRYKTILGGEMNYDSSLKNNLNVLNALQGVGYILDKDITSEDMPCSIENPSEFQEREYERELIGNREVYNLLDDNTFHFVFQYDKRGRVYSKGYHANIQSVEYRKAMLKFAKYETLTDRGWYWLKVDLANHFGLDKESFETRVQFIDDNIDDMLSDKAEWIEQASDKLLFKSALNSYEYSLVTGMSNQIVRLDATCSGFQLMSTIMRDVNAMHRLNVLGQTRRDFYTEVAKDVYEHTKESTHIWGDTVDWKHIRELCKKAIMTSAYNSEAKPKEVFGEKSKELREFYKSLDKLAYGARQLQADLNSCWEDDAYYNLWTLPDGHQAYCPVKKKIKFKIEVTELKCQMNYETYVNEPTKEEWRSLCLNIVHSLDAWVCRQVVSNLADLGIEVSPIHDSFGINANHCDTLRTSYRGCLSRLYREPIIDNIVSEILGEDVVIERPKYDKTIDEAIIANVDGYYIC